MSPRLPPKPLDLRTPLLVWAALMLALVVSALYALWPAAPMKIVVGLGVSLVKVALIGLWFMRLDKASPLIRLTAAGGGLWLLILFVFLFSDIHDPAGRVSPVTKRSRNIPATAVVAGS